MRAAGVVTAFVLAGIALAVAAAVATGLGAVSVILLGLIVALGALSVAVARRSDRGTVGPATCAECGGLMSPNAPYCKHCGTPVG